MTIKITGEWSGPCPACGAPHSCCATSKDRRDTADSLGNLVARQAGMITKLQREVAEAYQVIADIRRPKAGA